MRRIIWGGVFVAVISFVIFSNDPLNDVANFIIGGSIPGTNSSIGMWSTLGLVGFLLWVVTRGFKRTKFQMIEHHNANKADEKDFESSYAGDFDPKERSVIAAPKAENSF
jgi:hypothetical protein